MRRLLVVVVTVLGIVACTRGAVAVGPTVELSASNVRVGDTIVVTLAGWPSATTIALCGDGGRRGSADCDLIGAVGLEATANGSDSRQLVVGQPPVACPCVVRAFTDDGAVERRAPIQIAGVAAADAPARSTGNDLIVSATFVHTRTSFVGRVRAWLGGPTQRRVRLTVRNISSSPLTNISVNAAVGRATTSGAPLTAPVIDHLAPSRATVEVLSATLGAPVHGRYQVFGTVYGPGSAHTFAVHTSVTPWGLYLCVLVAAVDLALLMRRHPLFRFRSR